MKAVGFNFKKISIEKLSDKTENIKVNTNIDISEISSVKTNLFKTEEEFLGVKFKYEINYNPNYAKLEFEGNIIVSVDQKKSKEIIKEWENKKIPEEFRIFLFNIILKKANLKALELEDEMNIPLHIPLPSVKKSDKNN